MGECGCAYCVSGKSVGDREKEEFRGGERERKVLGRTSWQRACNLMNFSCCSASLASSPRTCVRSEMAEGETRESKRESERMM